MNILFHRSRLSFSLALVALNVGLFVTEIAQTPKVEDDKWTRIESASKDFSIALPLGNYIVDNEKAKVRLWYTDKGRAFSISMEKMGDAKTRLKALIASSHDPRFQANGTTGYQTIQLDDFLGRWYTETSKKNGSEYYSFEFASSHGSYLISVRVPKGDGEFAKRFLRTGNLGGKPFITSDTSGIQESQTISINSLQTSDVVKQALKQPAADLKFNKDSKTAGPPADDNTSSVYSRDLIIFSKPSAPYTDEARSRNIQGTVGLRVKFLSTGTIGSIKVANTPGGGLDKQAFDAAKQIKFLPAEINGKPVDVTRFVVYQFTIY